MASNDLTPEQHKAEFNLLRTDPERYLAIANERVAQSPNDADTYFSRHFAWRALGQLNLALSDIDRSLELERHLVTLRVRGRLLREMGRYDEAIAAFDESEAMDPKEWVDASGPLFRADCYARLGKVEEALADCAKLREDHWTPGVFGTPAGNKKEVTAEIRRMALTVRRAGG